MKIKAFLLILLLCFSSLEALSKSTNNKNSLWKIKTAQNTIYLLGSIHLLNKNSYPLPKALEDAYQDSQKIVLEIVTNESAEEKAALIQMGLYKDGKTLKDDLSEETLKALKARLEKAKLNFPSTEAFKPWMQIVGLTISELQKLGFQPEYGIDKHFEEKARIDKKELIGLETAEFQIRKMDELNQENFVKASLNDLDNTQKFFLQILKTWRGGDSKQLFNLLYKSLQNYPEVYDKLLVQRNKNWLPKIEALSQEKENVLIVVGVAHLVGPDSIIALLGNKGYKVEQTPN